ncbi:small acid-soluble spore protein Tlp [Paenibacillus turpanensis]|uniref:small acid-soluble spore protein Tlp n=1 Tax=Paenibacillus turpanensis TaxID=2689078 RepID=UPI00140BEA22|nr:small acid-soluble spore protein Tlp [Paenibacillus turpanensis]
MAKPDNRADNVEKMQEMIQHTQENMHEAQEYLNEFGDEMTAEQRGNMEEKNERRRASIEKFREEIKDEAHK